MRFLGCVLLLLCACSSGPAPRTYRQGVFVPVETPAFSPVEDAPIHVGQPGYVSPEDVPRSPYRRVLPQTPETRREAGIWAAGGNHDEPIPDIRIFDVPIPVSTSAKTADDVAPTSWCAGEMLRRINDAGLKARIMLLSFAERRCLVAKLMDGCAQWTQDSTKIDRTAKVGLGVEPDDDTKWRIRVEAMAHASAKAFRLGSCSADGAETPVAAQALDDFIAHEDRTSKRGWRVH